MSMNSISDIDDYDSFDFHFMNRYEQRRPLVLTAPNAIYPLIMSEKGTKEFVFTSSGKPAASPRSLLMLCVNKLINDEKILQKLDEHNVSANIFSLVFREAILFGQFSLIVHLISIWPNSYLKLSDLISSEIINYDSLSKPLFPCGPTILDYVLLGILISKPSSRLKTVDFTGFHKDLKLTREICHLPLLWLKPENRNYQAIYERIKCSCIFEKNQLKRFLENFNEIYQEYDRLIEHELDYGEKTLILDCHINCEDVILGLALQNYTPFRFDIRKVWCTYGFVESEYSFKNYDFAAFTNSSYLTHLCLKDLFMIETPSDMLHLCSVLEKLNNLVGLSLIRVLNFYPSNYSNEEINEVCTRINKTLRRSYKLKRIDFSFNFLRSRLFRLLHGLVQPLEYLNLQDCRLDSTDIGFLNSPSMLKCIKSCRELNLSMNDFSQSHASLFSIVASCPMLNCLSISYCQIAFELICQDLVSGVILREDEKCVHKDDNNDESACASAADVAAVTTSFVPFSLLKYVCVQPFTPPKMHEILDILHSFALVKSLQRICFLPSLYAFPGSNDQERELSADKIIRICAGILESKGRNDIDFINHQ